MCAWYDVVTEQGGPVPPVLVAEPRPAGTDARYCSATARGPGPDGEPISVTAGLWWDDDGAELGLEIVAGEGGYDRSRVPDGARLVGGGGGSREM